MSLPKITIITPSFNQAQYLEATIISVLSQNYPNLEFIIIDGGSTDHSVQIIERYKDQLTYWTSEKDRGQSDAINKGFARSTGQIMTWLNSDDQLLPNSLMTVAQTFKDNPELGLVHGEAILFGEGIRTHSTRYQTEDAAARQLAGLPFAQPAAFFSRKAFEKSGFLDESLHYGMDYAFFLPIFLNFPTKYLPIELAKYLYHPLSKTVSSQALFAKDYSKVFSKLLRSSKADNLKLRWQAWNFYDEGQDIFILNEELPAEPLRLAASYNLYFQMIFNYQGLNLDKVQQITAYFKKLEPEFIKKHKEIEQVYWRCRLFPKWLIRWLRKSS